MQVYTQIALCVSPLAAALFVATSLISPLTMESEGKATQIESLSQQYQILEVKLNQRQKLQDKQKQIQEEIGKLRNSVPSNPDLDLFLFDLEKMCESNQVVLLGVEDNETSKSGKDKKELIASLVEEVGGKMPAMGTKQPAKKQPIANRQKPSDDAEKDPLGLKHETKRIFISGKYQGLVGVLSNLEKYQRIVGIRDLVIAAPADDDKEVLKTLASEKGKQMGLSQPVMTFLVHIYYLPENN